MARKKCKEKAAGGHLDTPTVHTGTKRVHQKKGVTTTLQIKKRPRINPSLAFNRTRRSSKVYATHKMDLMSDTTYLHPAQLESSSPLYQRTQVQPILLAHPTYLRSERFADARGRAIVVALLVPSLVATFESCKYGQSHFGRRDTLHKKPAVPIETAAHEMLTYIVKYIEPRTIEAQIIKQTKPMTGHTMTIIIAYMGCIGFRTELKSGSSGSQNSAALSGESFFSSPPSPLFCIPFLATNSTDTIVSFSCNKHLCHGPAFRQLVVFRSSIHRVIPVSCITFVCHQWPFANVRS